MKKLAVVVIISAISVSSWSMAEGRQTKSTEELYVVVGKHCFNREFNESLYNELIEKGVLPDLAEEKASGAYTMKSEFCTRFRSLIETMSLKIKR